MSDGTSLTDNQIVDDLHSIFHFRLREIEFELLFESMIVENFIIGDIPNDQIGLIVGEEIRIDSIESVATILEQRLNLVATLSDNQG